MIKSITNFLIIFFIFQQLKSQISQLDQNGVNPFCDETLYLSLVVLVLGGGLWSFNRSVLLRSGVIVWVVVYNWNAEVF